MLGSDSQHWRPLLRAFRPASLLPRALRLGYYARAREIFEFRIPQTPKTAPKTTSIRPHAPIGNPKMYEHPAKRSEQRDPSTIFTIHDMKNRTHLPAFKGASFPTERFFVIFEPGSSEKAPVGATGSLAGKCHSYRGR